MNVIDFTLNYLTIFCGEKWLIKSFGLTLPESSKIVAEDTFFYFSLSTKIRLNVSCESSAAVVIGGLRVNITYIYMAMFIAKNMTTFIYRNGNDNFIKQISNATFCMSNRSQLEKKLSKHVTHLFNYLCLTVWTRL